MTVRKRVEAESVNEVVYEAPYHIKYRPTVLGDVVGQDDVVKSLKGALASKSRQHCYFFFGPGGTGKTTLARIMANEFGCMAANIVEVDAASNSGVDEVRKLTEGMRYNGFGEQPNKAYVIDECHRLSASAWDALLKSTEEPPPHVFFFFCSTNPAKVPKAMLTRGPNLALQPVRFDGLMDLLEWVCKQENLPTPDAVLDVVARASDGSPRQALVMLAMAQDCADAADAEAVLQGVGEVKEVIDLCRQMIKGGLRWTDVQKNLEPLKDLGAEGIRIQVSLYLAAVLMSCKEREAGRLLDMLDAFSEPANPTDKLAPVLRAFGRFVDLGG